MFLIGLSSCQYGNHDGELRDPVEADRGFATLIIVLLVLAIVGIIIIFLLVPGDVCYCYC